LPLDPFFLPASAFEITSSREEVMKRAVTIAALMVLGWVALDVPAHAERACRDCTDQYQRCMKNYPGPTCKTERDICSKSCKK
jgi:hypothetical protein